jgi:hypothetical protein
MMSASASPLPHTGGTPLLPLLSAGALALMAGSWRPGWCAEALELLAIGAL